MKKAEFDELFEEFITKPLCGLGFEFVRDSKTLVQTNEHAQLALIRLGGRYSRQGCINQIICFRHDFLRPVNSEKKVMHTTYFSDYPYKLTLDDFVFRLRFLPIFYQPKYKPINLGTRKTELIRFDNANPRYIKRTLKFQADIIEQRIIPWTRKLQADIVASEILQFGENAWCEKRWLEDYMQKPKKSSS